jgi:Glycosyltransferase
MYWRRKRYNTKNNCQISFLKYIHDIDKLVRYYQAADVLVHSSKAETFALTIAEALACGTPVIASQVCAIPEVVHDLHLYGEKATGLLYPTGNAHVLAEKISFLFTNKSLREQMSLQAVQDAHNRFDLQKQIEAYIDLYKNLLHPSPTTKAS